MLLLLAGCLFIDDAEHAAFLAGLTDSGDPSETGDTGGAPALWHAGEALSVVELGAGFSVSNATRGFGSAVALGWVDELGLSAAVGETGLVSGRSWLVPVSALTLGTVLEDVGVPTEPGGADLGTAVGFAQDEGGELHLVAGDPGTSRLVSYTTHRSGSPTEDGLLVGESSNDELGAVFVSAADGSSAGDTTVGVGAPGNGAGVAYVSAWPLRDGDELDAQHLWGAAGRKFVPGAGYEGQKSRFGASLALGDAAGEAAVLIGAPDEPGSESSGMLGGAWLGADVLNLDNDDGVVVPGALTHIRGANPLTHFGSAVLIADVDDDGRDDLVIGAPNENPEGALEGGAVYIFLGGDLPTSDASAADAHVVLRGDTRGAHFGSALAYVPQDPPLLLIGAPDWSGNSGSLGAVFVVTGGPLDSDTTMATAARIEGQTPDGRFGAALAANEEGALVAEPGGPASAARFTGAAWWLSLRP